MKIARREFKSDGKHIAAYFVYCPACLRAHRFIVENEQDPKHIWVFDGSMEAPTFNPSLLVESGGFAPGSKDEICHSYLQEGIWKFQQDSTHHLAGQAVPMIDFPPNYRV